MGLENPLHIVILLLVVLLVFGAKRLPEMGRSMGEGLRGFKDAINNHGSPVPEGAVAPVREGAVAPVREVAVAPAPALAAAPERPTGAGEAVRSRDLTSV